MAEIEQEAEKKSNLSFSDALERIKSGEHMTRDFWLKQPVSMRVIKLTITHVSLIPEFESEDQQLALVLENDIGEIGTINNWTPNKEDMFTDDWRVYGCVDAEVIAEKMIEESVGLPGLPLIPIYREESKHLFVDSSVITPHVVQLDDQLVETSVLKFGAKFDMLGLSTVDVLLSKGIQDYTDCIDPAITLANAYLNVDDAIAKVSLLNHPYSTAAASVMGNYCDQVINYNGKLEIGDVKVDVSILGTINLQFGTVELHAKLGDVYTNMGQDVKVELLGYDIQAYRVNPNRRPR